MNTKRSNDKLERLSPEAYAEIEKHPLVIILDNVRSAQNVGSFFRTMDAFSTAAIYLCGITPQPPHREINKTALGASNTVAWEYFERTEDAIDKLKSMGYEVLAVEQAYGAVMLNDYDREITDKTAFIFGNEVEGVSQKVLDLCDKVIEIPQYGTKHSLNIAVCAGIVMWHAHGRKL